MHYLKTSHAKTSVFLRFLSLKWAIYQSPLFRFSHFTLIVKWYFHRSLIKLLLWKKILRQTFCIWSLQFNSIPVGCLGRSTPCPSVKHGDEWGEPSKCESGDSCQYCHSRTEQQFHPEVRPTHLYNTELEWLTLFSSSHQLLFVSRFTNQRNATTWGKLDTVQGVHSVLLHMWKVSMFIMMIDCNVLKLNTCSAVMSLSSCMAIRKL